MSRKDRLKGIFDDTADELATANFSEPEQTRGPAGPVRSMALTLGRMEEASKALQDAIVAGEHVIDLDPALIDVSFVRDRLSDAPMSLDDELVQSISESGQEVPILVREHRSQSGRYQVAYGHRRLQAARLLGKPVRAIVRNLEDRDLVVAQGVENSARKNLSYIERAVFAFALEERGFERPVIMKALTTDKTELSKLISVAKSVPEDVVRAIGTAPAAGRRKWIEFAERLDASRLSRLRAIFGQPDFQQAESDRRFEIAKAMLVEKATVNAGVTTWMPSGSGDVAASIRTGGRSYTLALKAGEAAGFGNFITSKLDELYREFKQVNTGE